MQSRSFIYLFIFTFYSLLLQILEVLDNQSLYQESVFFLLLLSMLHCPHIGNVHHLIGAETSSIV